MQADYKVSKVAQHFVYAIPIFGIALVSMSDDVWKFGQTWVWLSLLLYVVAIGLSHGVLMPAVERMQALMAERNALGPPPRAGGPPGVGGPRPGRSRWRCWGSGPGPRARRRTSWSSHSSP